LAFYKSQVVVSFSAQRTAQPDQLSIITFKNRDIWKICCLECTQKTLILHTMTSMHINRFW